MAQTVLPPLSSIPPDLVSVADYERYARPRVNNANWAYLNGAAADGLTARHNQEAFRHIAINPRVLQSLHNANTQLTLLGTDYDHPVFLAPVAYHKLAHTDGELATVTGASATRTGMVVSTQASTLLEHIAQNAHAPLWFQLYLQASRANTQDLVARAHTAGYQALVLTIDAPVSGIRNDEQRAGFRLPDGITAINLAHYSAAPSASNSRQAGNGPLFGSGLLANTATWADVQWLVEWSPLPVILKGVLNPDDALLARQTGCAGIIVSNHGGRTLDGVLPTIAALPAIRTAAGPNWPILLDGGIRRGSDVFKALALGANAVLVGRPYIYGLAAAGATGVAHVVQLLRGELEVTMALAGCANIQAITPAAVFRPGASNAFSGLPPQNG